jgi:hypothetical protein
VAFTLPGAEGHIITPNEDIVQTSSASRLDNPISSLFVLPVILMHEAQNLLPTFSTIHNDVKQDEFEQTYEASKDGETIPHYLFSATEQFMLLRLGMHYLTQWLPWNQEKPLVTEEIDTLNRNKTKLKALYADLAHIQSGIIAESHLFDDKLSWINKTIREMRQKINSILKKINMLLKVN